MNLQKLPLLLGFNLILAIADVILLSKGILQLDNLVRIIIIIASIVIFIIGNYFILSSAYKKPRIKNVENADYDDFEDALKGWKGMNTPFNKQIDVALKQLELFNSRKDKLKALSQDSTFDSAIDEVQSNMFGNFNRLINRLLIFDKNDRNDFARSRDYINKLINTNEQYLDVFRKFIDEIAMLGDVSESNTTLSLQTITESLREIRTNGETDEF
ncbi:MAG: hypothetical protein IKJ60_02320 [Ruminococcus sp.]|jgi:hypothetical protein|nr:hypothetical protein [Ruminococcus sp.]